MVEIVLNTPTSKMALKSWRNGLHILLLTDLHFVDIGALVSTSATSTNQATKRKNIFFALYIIGQMRELAGTKQAANDGGDGSGGDGGGGGDDNACKRW